MKMSFLLKEEKSEIIEKLKRFIGKPECIKQDKLLFLIKEFEKDEMKKEDFAKLILVLDYICVSKTNYFDYNLEKIERKCIKRFSFLFGDSPENVQRSFYKNEGKAN